MAVATDKRMRIWHSLNLKTGRVDVDRVVAHSFEKTVLDRDRSLAVREVRRIRLKRRQPSASGFGERTGAAILRPPAAAERHVLRTLSQKADAGRRMDHAILKTRIDGAVDKDRRIRTERVTRQYDVSGRHGGGKPKRTPIVLDAEPAIAQRSRRAFRPTPTSEPACGGIEHAEQPRPPLPSLATRNEPPPLHRQRELRRCALDDRASRVERLEARFHEPWRRVVEAYALQRRAAAVLQHDAHTLAVKDEIHVPAHHRHIGQIGQRKEYVARHRIVVVRHMEPHRRRRTEMVRAGGQSHGAAAGRPQGFDG